MKLFITGTDTGIGKTWVSAAVAAKAQEQGKSVGYYKPIQTGTPLGSPPEDPDFIHQAFEGQVKTYCRYCFEPPVTPLVADEKGIIDFQQIAQDVETYASHHDLLLIEGAGGLMVPTTSSHLMIDLIQSLHVPTLLVSHCRLGTMNHTLLSIEALQNRNITIYGVVFNFYPDDLTQADLAIQTLIPTLRPFIPSEIPLWKCLVPPPNQPLTSCFQTNFTLS